MDIVTYRAAFAPKKNIFAQNWKENANILQNSA